MKVKFGQRETSPLTCCCSPSPLCCIRLFIALCGFAWFEKLCHYISGQCLPLIPFALWLQTRCQRSQSAEGIHALYEAALIQLTSLAGFSGFYPARLQIEYFKAYQAHQWSWRGKGAIFILSASGKETVTHWRRLQSISWVRADSLLQNPSPALHCLPLRFISLKPLNAPSSQFFFFLFFPQTGTHAHHCGAGAPASPLREDSKLWAVSIHGASEDVIVLSPGALISNWHMLARLPPTPRRTRRRKGRQAEDEGVSIRWAPQTDN